jgi:benzoyl-CoA reductase/2-hydroxyglutaryl-CoA dehydratase subunit BcrC/BadD/HgdB
MYRWNSDGRLAFVGHVVAQHNVDGLVSEIVRVCTYEGWDKFDPKKHTAPRGIPILEFDFQYGHPAGARVGIRAEAFMDMLESRAGWHNRRPGLTCTKRVMTAGPVRRDTT